MSNDNQNRGMPADIDLLISAAESLILANNNERRLDRRFTHLEKITKKVRDQYNDILLNKEHIE